MSFRDIINDQCYIINHNLNSRCSAKAIYTMVQQARIKWKDRCTLMNNLITDIALIANLKHDFKSVKINKGAPGINKSSVEDIIWDMFLPDNKRGEQQIFGWT